MYIYIRLVLWMACVCVFSTAYNRDRLIKSSYLNVQPELSFGEDTELLHASVDLKWLSAALINKQTWRLMFCSILSKLKRFSASYDDIFTYQDIAAEIEYSIQELNTQISLSIIQSSLTTAHELALTKNRLLVFYIENDSRNPSIQTIKARKTISDANLCRIFNEQFLFMAGIDTHPYAVKILKYIDNLRSNQDIFGQLSSLDNQRPLIQNEGAARSLLNSELQPVSIEFPLLIVLAPISPLPPLWNIPFFPFVRRTTEWEVLGVLPVNTGVLSPRSISTFLHNVVQAVIPPGKHTSRHINHIDTDGFIRNHSSDPGV